MSKNPQGFTRSSRPNEWGRKARKQEDRLRSLHRIAAAEAVQTELEQMA